MTQHEGIRRVIELLEDEVSGRLSWSKVGKGVGIFAGTWAFMKIIWNAQPSEASAWLFLTYMGILVVPELFSRALSLKWGKTSGNGAGASAPPVPGGS